MISSRHLQAECKARESEVVCFTQKPRSALTMKMVAVMLVLLLFPALAFVKVGVFHQADGALPSLKREPHRGLAIRLRSSSKLMPAGNVDREGGISAKDTSKGNQSRNVRARRLHALVSDGECSTVATIFKLAGSRRLGPPNDPARVPSRPIKLFIICANHGLRKVKKVGFRVSLASPRTAPANQHVVPFENTYRRRALKQIPQLPIPPLPFTRPSTPLVSPPPPPQLRIPKLPPLPFVPPLPQLRMPPLPFHIPPFPCEPPSSTRSLPTP